MSDFITRLVERTLGRAEVAAPLIGPAFAPTQDAQPGPAPSLADGPAPEANAEFVVNEQQREAPPVRDHRPAVTPPLMPQYEASTQDDATPAPTAHEPSGLAPLDSRRQRPAPTDHPADAEPRPQRPRRQARRPVQSGDPGEPLVRQQAQDAQQSPQAETPAPRPQQTPPQPRPRPGAADASDEDVQIMQGIRLYPAPGQPQPASPGRLVDPNPPTRQRSPNVSSGESPETDTRYTPALPAVSASESAISPQTTAPEAHPRPEQAQDSRLVETHQRPDAPAFEPRQAQDRAPRRRQDQTPDAPSAQPFIRVTIGRVEVRANVQPPPAPRRKQRHAPSLGLSDYLKRRGGEA